MHGGDDVVHIADKVVERERQLGKFIPPDHRQAKGEVLAAMSQVLEVAIELLERHQNLEQQNAQNGEHQQAGEQTQHHHLGLETLLQREVGFAIVGQLLPMALQRPANLFGNGRRDHVKPAPLCLHHPVARLSTLLLIGGGHLLAHRHLLL